MARARENNFLMDFEDTGLQPSIQQMLAPPPVVQQPSMAKQPTMATDKATIIDNLVKQIQARSNTSQWSGGVDADQATKDMARILAETGITDISQFGPITQQVQKIVGYEDTGEPIYQTVTEQTYGNKVTGQAVPNTYTTRQTGNFFGGTYEGKGNTGYGVQFDEQGNPSFFTQGASSRDPIVKAAIPIGALALGTLGAQSLFGGAATGATGAGSAGASGLTAAEAAGLGLTATEAAALGLPAAEFAAAGTGGLLSGATPSIASVAPEIASTSFDLANAGIAGGTSGFTAAELAAIEAAQTANAGGLLSSVVPAAIAPSVAPAVASVAPEVVASTVAPAAASAVAPTVASTVAPAVASTAGGLLGSAIPSTIGGALASGALSSLGGSLGGLLSTGLTLGGGLLQEQTAREAAQKAQAMIEAETAAAKQAAQFRPVGMTTRFGTSEFKVDPTTGQLVSAGYTLTPEAKAQQDRLVALQNQGLTQAEQAQAQFAPLQTGAQSLFNLGNQYLAQSPQSVAQNYLNQQLALLQPGRELELANLQNRLQQQGRSGLSVAQGGSYGATTPELQALYNARAMQEAQLAAQAQQAGQQQVQFGAGLLGQGASAMGQYYGGQQAAYQPYTTASGQVQGLEALGQQPLTMGSTLGQQASTSGAKAGQLGLEGARLSAGLATSQAATTNPYASLMGGLGASSAFGTAADRFIRGLFS